MSLLFMNHTVATAPAPNFTDDYSDLESPASPTAALTCYAEEDTVVAKKKLKKSVSFAEHVKQHDGLQKRNQVFDSLICCYFVEQREISELDILEMTNNELGCIFELHEDLVDMMNRIDFAVAEGKNCAPVLPRGGGLCTKLCSPHKIYLCALARVVRASYERVEKAMEHQQASVI